LAVSVATHLAASVALLEGGTAGPNARADAPVIAVAFTAPVEPEASAPPTPTTPAKAEAGEGPTSRRRRRPSARPGAPPAPRPPADAAVAALRASVWLGALRETPYLAAGLALVTRALATTPAASTGSAPTSPLAAASVLEIAATVTLPGMTVASPIDLQAGDDPGDLRSSGGVAILSFTLPDPPLVTVTIGLSPSPFIAVEATFPDDAGAGRWLDAWPETRQRLLFQSPRLVLAGLTALLTPLAFIREGPTLRGRVEITPSEAARTLDLVALSLQF